MPAPKIAAKYAKLFADAEAIKKGLGGRAGTMPIDVAAFRAALEAKLGDAQFMTGLVREYIKAAEVKIIKG
jgi:hypothetical protein